MQIQAVNAVGNLLFFVFFLATVVLAGVLAYRGLRGRPTRKLFFAMVVCLCAYMVILIAVSLASTTRQLALGMDKCFDDWCATVAGARSLTISNEANGTRFVAIALRISNRARRAAFRPSQPRVTLVLPAGGSVSPSNSAQRELEKQMGPQEDLAKRLVAGDSFQTAVAFEVPAATREASIVVLEGPSLITRFLVGDENSFFHRKTVYPVTLE